MASKSTDEHRQAAEEKFDAIRLAVVTISDTRTEESDKSGKLMRELLAGEGHEVVDYAILRDEPDLIRDHVVRLCLRDDVEAILTNGGTGIAPRDGTYETIKDIIERPLPGFGELFRMLSWDQVGAASMLSRAIGGLRGTTLIFSMPGSSNAVEVAMTRLIIPELKHLVYEMRGKIA